LAFDRAPAKVRSDNLGQAYNFLQKIRLNLIITTRRSFLEALMGLFAEPWLRAARDHIKLVSDNAPDKKANPDQFDKLAEAVEKAIKAALVENHGSVPQQLEHQNLVSICQATGVWDVLPPALRGLVQEVQSFRAANSPAPVQQSSAEQLHRYFIVARGLIDYMEFHIIGNDSVLKRLTVA